MNVIARWGLVIVVVGGLGIDAYTHLDLAKNFDLNTTGTVNEGILFRLEAIGAILAALALVASLALLGYSVASARRRPVPA